MEYLVQLLQQYLSDPAIFRVTFTLFVAVSMFLFGIALLFLVNFVFDPLKRRLRLVDGNRVPQQDSSGGSVLDAIEPLGDLSMPKNDWERSKVSQKLVHAGFRKPSALRAFYAIKTLLVLSLPVLVLIAATTFPYFKFQQVIISLLIVAFLGLILPDAVLDNLSRRRKTKLRNGFADALDLLVVCTEAGLGLNQAIDRVGNEISDSYPELASELKLYNAQIRAGMQRDEALRDLAHRTGLEDIHGLVALLTQSMRLGTGVADTLRVYAEEFRDKRIQRAEELAAKIGTKMIFPLVVCLFPGFFVIVLGPAVLRILETFGRLS